MNNPNGTCIKERGRFMRYEIQGEPLPVVVCELQPGEKMITERGSMMQRLSGKGMAFVEIDGYAVEYDLDPGEKLVVDTGYLAAMSGSCSIDIQTVPGIKNKLFGGEGFFNTVVTGPGKVILQTMPISTVAGALRPFFPTTK